MARRKSSSRSLERRAVLDALARIACRFRTDTLIAWLPVLTVLATDERLPATPGLVQRFDEKLRLLRLFGAFRETTPRHKATDNEIAQRVCDMARTLDPEIRVSPRSLRRWLKAYNTPMRPRSGGWSDGLAGPFRERFKACLTSVHYAHNRLPDL